MTCLLGSVIALFLLASSAFAQCIGDCNDDGRVTVAELITGVNVEMGDVELAACPAIDCNTGPFGIVINCLTSAVNNALEGCTGAAPNCTVEKRGDTYVVTCTW